MHTTLDAKHLCLLKTVSQCSLEKEYSTRFYQHRSSYDIGMGTASGGAPAESKAEFTKIYPPQFGFDAIDIANFPGSADGEPAAGSPELTLVLEGACRQSTTVFTFKPFGLGAPLSEYELLIDGVSHGTCTCTQA